MLTSTGRTLFYRCWLLDQLVTLAWKHLFGQSIYFESLKLSLHFIKCVHVMCDVRVILFCLAQRCDWCWPVCCWAQSYCSMAQTKVDLYLRCIVNVEKFFWITLSFCLVNVWALSFLICLLGISCSKWRGADGAREEKQLDLSAEQLACHVTN